MRTRIVVGALVVVALVIAVVAWQSCGSSRTATTSAGGGGTAGTAGHSGAGRSGSRTAKGPIVPALLSGRVTRASDGAGIAGAVVSIAPAELMAMFIQSDSPTLVVVTDATGTWKAPQVRPGAYVVAASAAGYLPGSKDKLVIGSGEQQSGIDIVLTAGGTIVRGTVSDVGGGPIADARITATHDRNMPELGGRPSFITTTGPDGRYELTLADGAFDVAATHDDYTSENENVVVAGSPVTVDFTLVPGAVIRGQVVARDSGKPVPDAFVRADGAGNNGGGGGSVMSDASGNFTLRSLNAGSIEIHAIARGYATPTPTVVSIGIGEQVDDVRVVVDRAYSISGRVVRKGKQDTGLPGITLGAFSIAAKSFGLALEPSAEDGGFEIVGLRPASYMLGAIGEGSVPEIGKNVEVVDKDVEDVIVELAAGATIAGRVEPATAGVVVSVAPQGQMGIMAMLEAAKAMLVRGETDATGAFTLHNVPAGTFKLQAQAPDGPAGSLPLLVADADQTGLVVKLESRGSVSGRVIDTSGKPVAGVQVTPDRMERDASDMSISFGGRNAGASSAADGSFKLVGLEAGKYMIRATMDDDRFDWHSPKKGEPPPKNQAQVEVTATTVKTGVTLTIEARDGTIRGTVLGPDRNPAPDAWVTARRVTAKPEGLPPEVADRMEHFGASTPPVLTNASGQFTIGKLRRGTYNLVVKGPRGMSHAEKPNLKAGDNVTIQLAALGSLSGKVTAAGAPVAKYDIECDGRGTETERHIEAADGAYTVDRLAPGPYTCNVMSDTGTATGNVEVPAGPVKLDFSLARWATVSGVVVSVLDKKPVAGLNVFAGGDAFSSQNVEGMLTGKAPVTDAAGHFVLERVAAGNGKVAVMPKDGFSPLGSKVYTAVEGQRIDVGTIEIVPPRTGDAGTFGFATNVDGDKLLVTSVKEGGPAAIAGMQVGDRITSIGGRDVAALTLPIAQTLLASGSIGVGQQTQVAIDRAGTPIPMTLVSVKW